MLLPGMSNAAVSLVAVDGRRQLVIGAAIATRLFRRKPLVGPGIAMHVIDPCRRQGIGRNFRDLLEAVAKAAGAAALYGAKRVDLGSDEMRGWERLGFSRCESVEEHVLPIEKFEQRLRPLVERARATGRIPTNACIVPLFQANLPAVLQLHLEHMGGDPGELYRKLLGKGPGAFLPRQSRVLVVDDEVKGCLLARRTGKDAITIDANIVVPSLRGGWANAWLKLEAFRGAPLGVKEFRFTSFNHYRDTRSFAKKLGGVTTSTSVLMFRPLERSVER